MVTDARFPSMENKVTQARYISKSMQEVNERDKG